LAFEQILLNDNKAKKSNMKSTYLNDFLDNKSNPKIRNCMNHNYWIHLAADPRIHRVNEDRSMMGMHRLH
jgi:hypothetical protein